MFAYMVLLLQEHFSWNFKRVLELPQCPMSLLRPKCILLFCIVIQRRCQNLYVCECVFVYKYKPRKGGRNKTFWNTKFHQIHAYLIALYRYYIIFVRRQTSKLFAARHPKLIIYGLLIYYIAVMVERQYRNRVIYSTGSHSRHHHFV